MTVLGKKRWGLLLTMTILNIGLTFGVSIAFGGPAVTGLLGIALFAYLENYVKKKQFNSQQTKAEP